MEALCTHEHQYTHTHTNRREKRKEKRRTNIENKREGKAYILTTSTDICWCCCRWSCLCCCCCCCCYCDINYCTGWYETMPLWIHCFWFRCLFPTHFSCLMIFFLSACWLVFFVVFSIRVYVFCLEAFFSLYLHSHSSLFIYFSLSLSHSLSLPFVSFWVSFIFLIRSFVTLLVIFIYDVEAIMPSFSAIFVFTIFLFIYVTHGSFFVERIEK